ncbi:MAG: peptide chain release factor 1 [Ardenticatenaceae bacterium]|nr:peptide chain release factor 1 [Ardenticatenaceae bacterium]HBY95054.1 peptide chain release factor 1 [Chloroflexota bacterium]
MFDALARVAERYEELNQLMADPEVATDPDRLRAYAVEQAELEELVATYRRYQAVAEELVATRAMLESDETLDDEMEALVREEVERLEAESTGLEECLKRLLLPKDPNDEKNVIVEIRAGAGGDEAGLFAADLFRMYTRYAENHGWKADLISTNETGVGGFKEVIFEVRGRGAYSRLKYESGVHRVQRVPATEASGRIHTSTATVIVLPEMEEVEVEINPNDLRIDVFRSGGHGGQSVNTTDSAVRITHLPTGLVVTCQDEKSQLQNKLKAMRVLRARLYELEEEQRLKELGETRRGQIGSGERSEKIRTYNFPQNRVTDHRIGLTSYQLDAVLNGALNEFIESLATSEQAARLAELDAA